MTDDTVLSRIGKAGRNALRDVVLIVISILIAFALDAWWGNTQDARRLTRHLGALEHEFSQIRVSLTANRQDVSQAARATRAILGEMGRRQSPAFSDSIAKLLNSSYDAGVVVSQGGALSTILSSGDIRLINDDSLAYMLAQWPLEIQRLNSNNAILTASREQELRMRLIELGIPESAIASNIPELALPKTKFGFNPNTVLLDAGVESMLVSRLIRLRILEAELESAIRSADLIIERLRQVD